MCWDVAIKPGHAIGFCFGTSHRVSTSALFIVILKLWCNSPQSMSSQFPKYAFSNYKSSPMLRLWKRSGHPTPCAGHRRMPSPPQVSSGQWPHRPSPAGKARTELWGLSRFQMDQTLWLSPRIIGCLQSKFEFAQDMLCKLRLKLTLSRMTKF